jgi:hypothetical protein
MTARLPCSVRRDDADGLGEDDLAVAHGHFLIGFPALRTAAAWHHADLRAQDVVLRVGVSMWLRPYGR